MTPYYSVEARTHGDDFAQLRTDSRSRAQEFAGLLLAGGYYSQVLVAKGNSLIPINHFADLDKIP